MGDCNYEMQAFSKAIDMYQTLLDLGTQLRQVEGLGELHYKLANCYYIQKQSSKALEHYKQAYLLNAHQANCCINIGQVLLQKQRP